MVAKNNIAFGENQHLKFKNICIVSLRITNQICKIVHESIVFNYSLESCGLSCRSTYFLREFFKFSIHFLKKKKRMIHVI